MDRRHQAERERAKRNKIRRRRAEVTAMREKKATSRLRSARSRRWRSKKLSAIAILFLCALGFFLFEISQWQSFAGEAYAVRTLTQVFNRHSEGDVVLQPSRGTITDRNMQSLAVSTTVYNVFIDVRMLAQREADEQASNRLALTEFFGIEQSYFDGLLARNSDGVLIHNTYFHVVLRGLTHSEIESYEAWLENMTTTREGFRIRDIHLQEDALRNYVFGNVAAPIVGFWRGIWWGLEDWYNEYLQGTIGRSMTVFDADGNLSSERIPPVNGGMVVTTLDMAMQRFSEEIAMHFAQDFYATHSSVIIMQPFTGELFALAQYPSFDSNSPADADGVVGAAVSAHLAGLEPNSQEFFNYMMETVWRNFNITRTFEPGSTYKSITMAKALEEGIITPGSMFYCPGYKEVAGHRIHCSRRWGHGRINLTQALAVSCNVATMDIAELLGRDLFWQYQRDFGYGVLTGIDFPGENAGYIFSLSGLNDSELATSSFGQRFTATPIQTISSFATLINGGNVVRPHLVSQVIGADGEIVFAQNAPQVQRRVISTETSDWFREAMEYVVTEGTGQAAGIEGFAIAGKTATSENGTVGEPESYSLSFIGYFPIDNPQYLVMVLLHEVPIEVFEAGGRSAAPMFREVAQEIILLRGMVPTQGIHAQNPVFENDSILVENFVGMTVPQAVSRLNALGFEYEFIGVAGNFVAAQFPAANTRISGESPNIVLSLEEDGQSILEEIPNVAGLPLDFAREILIEHGFVPRVVHDGYFSEDDTLAQTQLAVRSQVLYGMRLPIGTEVLLRVQISNNSINGMDLDP